MQNTLKIIIPFNVCTLFRKFSLNGKIDKHYHASDALYSDKETRGSGGLQICVKLSFLHDATRFFKVFKAFLRT